MIGGAAQRARPAVLQPSPFLLEVADPAEESNLRFEGFDLLFQNRLLIREGFDLTRELLLAGPEGLQGRFQTVQCPAGLFDPVDDFVRLKQKTLALLQGVRLIAPPADDRVPGGWPQISSLRRPSSLCPFSNPRRDFS